MQVRWGLLLMCPVQVLRLDRQVQRFLCSIDVLRNSSE
jgi:hypothetical protein